MNPPTEHGAPDPDGKQDSEVEPRDEAGELDPR